MDSRFRGNDKMSETQVNSTKRKGLAELLDPGRFARTGFAGCAQPPDAAGRGSHGQRRSKRRGQSVEFADHRGYVAGDDLRFVDWNIYGRLEQLVLKLFLEEQDLTVHILLDTTGSIALPEPAKARSVLQLGAARCRSRWRGTTA